MSEQVIAFMKVEPKILLNLVAFQVAWLACVLGGAHDSAWVGTIVAGGVIVLHLALARWPRPEALLIAVAAVLGLLWDSGLVALGLISYNAGNFAPGFAPHWIVAMWALFATTLNRSMAWLRGRAWLATLVGAVGGPLAYLAGERLGALQMPDPTLALGAQALGWAVALPLMVRLATRLNGCGPAAPAPSSSTPREARSNV